MLEPYSSRGPTADGRLKPDLSAPSVVDSASYTPDPFDGTSAAAPHVAGAAALLLQAFPELTPDDLADFFRERAIDLGSAGPDNAFGVGRLNLDMPPEQAIELTEGTPPARRAHHNVRAPEQPAVGLPADIDVGGEAGGLAPEDEDGTLGFLIVFGLCLICLAGLLILVLAVIAIMAMRRK